MLVKVDYPAMSATATLSAGEEFNAARLDLAVHQVALDPAGIWNFDLFLNTRIYNDHADDLAKLGFVIAGTASEGNHTALKLRKSLRRSGDGHAAMSSLAMPAPVLPPTLEEMSARLANARTIVTHYSESGIDDRVAALEQDANIRRAMREQRDD